jgi:hypothetical protein
MAKSTRARPDLERMRRWDRIPNLPEDPSTAQPLARKRLSGPRLMSRSGNAKHVHPRASPLRRRPRWANTHPSPSRLNATPSSPPPDASPHRTTSTAHGDTFT